MGADGNRLIDVTVTCAVIGLTPSGVTGLPATAHVVLLGAPVHVSATAWLNPLIGVTVTLNIWLEWCDTVTADGAVTVKSVPVPLNATVCGLPLASSVTVSVPVRLPVAVGLNVTLGWRLDPAVRVAPHGFDTAKSPEAVIEAMFSVALPLFFRVTGWPVLVVVTS